MNLMDKRKQQPFYLTSDARVYKPQPSGKALLRAALIFGLTFLAGVLLVLRQLRLL
jgi:hypothetical protein